MKTGQQNYARRFGIPASPKKTILRWEQELFLTGSIKDKASTGEPLTRKGSCAEVEVSGERSSIKSLRKQSAELQIPKTTTLTLMAKDLQLKSFRPTFVNELSDKGREKRRVECGRFLYLFRTIPQRGKQWRAVSSEAGHAIDMRYFMNKTKKLSEILGRRPIFVQKLCCNQKKDLRSDSISNISFVVQKP